MRLKNMESLYFQLKDPKVRQIDIFLEKTESPYSEYFKNLVKNVTAGKYTIVRKKCFRDNENVLSFVILKLLFFNVDSNSILSLLI